MEAKTEFERNVERLTAGLSFLSTGACPGCEDCGLPSKWILTGLPEGAAPLMPFYDSEDEALEEVEALCAVFPGAEIGAEEKEPSQREIDLASEPGFSWSECDTCGSALGGDRHPAHARLSSGQLIHLSVCEDCLFYLNYGTLPGEES